MPDGFPIAPRWIPPTLTLTADPNPNRFRDDYWPGPILRGWVLTFFLEMRQHRLAVHAVLDDFRLLLTDLENLSASINAAQIFHVWQQESKGIEQGMYRKSGE